MRRSTLTPAAMTPSSGSPASPNTAAGAASKARKEASPMGPLSTNTFTSGPLKQASAPLPSKSPALPPAEAESDGAAAMPNIELDAATVALIKENEQMLQTITVLRHELDKQAVHLRDTEEARVVLADEVAELRSQLGLAASEVSSSTGRVLNYKTAFIELQYSFDQLHKDAEATKAKLEEATQRERLFMQTESRTARQQIQQKESYDLVTRALKMPQSFLVSIQRIVEKLNDATVRPADRHHKISDDIERLDAQVAAYKPVAESATMSADAVPRVDILIRQCVFAYLTVILKLLKTDWRK